MQALLDTIAAMDLGTDARRLFHGRGGLSVVALQAGARQEVNVDMSHGAMATGQQNPAGEYQQMANAGIYIDAIRRFKAQVRTSPRSQTPSETRLRLGQIERSFLLPR